MKTIVHGQQGLRSPGAVPASWSESDVHPAGEVVDADDCGDPSVRGAWRRES